MDRFSLKVLFGYRSSTLEQCARQFETAKKLAPPFVSRFCYYFCRRIVIVPVYSKSDITIQFRYFIVHVCLVAGRLE